MRVANWTIKLADAVQAAQGMTFEWGRNDCCQFAARVVAAITDRDPREIFPAYESEADAARIIAECGGLSELIARALGEPKAVSLAQRGDVVLCDFGRGLQPAICLGIWSVAPGLRGLEKRMTDTALAAWTV